jgi:hypothetical protein
VEKRGEVSPSRLQMASGLADTNNNGGHKQQQWRTPTTTMADTNKRARHMGIGDPHPARITTHKPSNLV